METATWLSPLIALPGVAMLVLSTSTRYAEVHAEIHRLSESHNLLLGRVLLGRARRFRNVLVALYACVGLLALAGLMGCAYGSELESLAGPAISGLTAAALLLLTVAAVELAREAGSSLRLMEHHVEDMDEGRAAAPPKSKAAP